MPHRKVMNLPVVANFGDEPDELARSDRFVK
jgi:hypothetical protein